MVRQTCTVHFLRTVFTIHTFLTFPIVFYLIHFTLLLNTFFIDSSPLFTLGFMTVTISLFLVIIAEGPTRSVIRPGSIAVMSPVDDMFVSCLDRPASRPPSQCQRTNQAVAIRRRLCGTEAHIMFRQLLNEV